MAARSRTQIPVHEGAFSRSVASTRSWAAVARAAVPATEVSAAPPIVRPTDGQRSLNPNFPVTKPVKASLGSRGQARQPSFSRRATGKTFAKNTLHSELVSPQDPSQSHPITAQGTKVVRIDAVHSQSSVVPANKGASGRLQQWRPSRAADRLLSDLPLVDLIPKLTSKAHALTKASAHVSAIAAPLNLRVARASQSHREGCDAVIDALTSCNAQFQRELSNLAFKLFKQFDTVIDDAEDAAEFLDAAVALSGSWQVASCSIEAVLDSLGASVALAETVAQLSTGSNLLFQLCSLRVIDVFSGGLRAHAIDADTVTAYGTGLRLFMPGPATTETSQRNSFELTLFDEAGMLADFICASDIDISVCAKTGCPADPTESPTCLARVSGAGDGCVHITYAVPAGIETISFQTRVCGVDIPAACVEVCGAYAGGSHALRSLVAPDVDKFGLAVSSDESWMAVTSLGSSAISVYSLPTGTCVLSIPATSESNCPWRVMFTRANDMLVCDTHASIVQLLSLKGKRLGSLPVRGAVCADLCGDTLAVGAGAYVHLFTFSTGKPMLAFGGDGSSAGDIGGACTSVRFMPAGETLLVAEFSTRRLSLFAINGSFLKFIGEGLLGVGWNDLAFTCTGNVIVADVSNHRMVLLDPSAEAGDQCVSIWGSFGSEPGQLRSPTAVAVVGSHLYVLDACAKSPRVQVFA